MEAAAVAMEEEEEEEDNNHHPHLLLVLSCLKAANTRVVVMFAEYVVSLPTMGRFKVIFTTTEDGGL